MTYHVHNQGNILGLEDDLDAIVQFVLDNFSVAGYGGIQLSAADETFPDLGAGYQTLVADTNTIDVPRGTTPDHTTNSVALNLEGVWQISIGFTIEHDSSNQGRTIRLRLRNTVDGTTSTPNPIGIGRNVEVTNWSITTLFQNLPDNLADPMVAEIGGGDTVLVTALDSYYFNVNYVSEYRGAPPNV